MIDPEFSRLVKARPLSAAPIDLSASAAERAALAERFALVRLDALNAQVTLADDGDATRASGWLKAALVQPCAVSGEPLEVSIEERVELLFVPAAPSTGFDEEIELAAGDLDEIPYTGDAFDLGEAIAQSLGLAIDPYAEGPAADEVRRAAGIVADDQAGGTLADALRALRPRE